MAPRVVRQSALVRGSRYAAAVYRLCFHLVDRSGSYHRHVRQANGHGALVTQTALTLPHLFRATVTFPPPRIHSPPPERTSVDR